MHPGRPSSEHCRRMRRSQHDWPGWSGAAAMSAAERPCSAAVPWLVHWPAQAPSSRTYWKQEHGKQISSAQFSIRKTQRRKHQSSGICIHHGAFPNFMRQYRKRGGYRKSMANQRRQEGAFCRKGRKTLLPQVVSRTDFSTV